MRIPFHLVDVFTDRPLAGNQLCVVPDGAGLSDALMQALAKEIGFSETTFVLEAAGDRYAMRIFMPGKELPFAGHPTLGTAFVLASLGRIGPTAVQSVAAGEFTVQVDLEAGTARMAQGRPTFGETSDRAEVATAIGLREADLGELPAMTVWTGLWYLVVPVAGPAEVTRAVPDVGRLERLVTRAGTDAVYLFAMDGERHARARLFAFGLSGGLGEDPATGSAAGPLGAYLAEQGVIGPGTLSISQGVEMGRPSTLVVEVAQDDDGWTIEVGGGVREVGRGCSSCPRSSSNPGASSAVVGATGAARATGRRSRSARGRSGS
jgi:trans-2,3-dihydro-3-hydroxyanthranilate isomerase